MEPTHDERIVRARDLVKHYTSGTVTVKALDGVSLNIHRGEFVSIMGTSGSGKSTLLHMLGGLDVPTSGKVYIDDYDLSALSPDELTIFRRRRIGFVFQAYNLLPMMTVWENIVLPIQLDGAHVDRDYVTAVIDAVGLSERCHEMPTNLSGGQQQRVAIARALASRPAVLFADEPTGNLDSRSSQDVLGVIAVSARQFGQTVVMITHNDEVAQLADRILRIEDGRLVDRSGTAGACAVAPGLHA